MKLSEAYPSNFLKADDLGGRDITVTIESVDLEDIGQGADKEQKLVLGFTGKSKKLVCNRTNAHAISEVLKSDETSDWIGQRIILTARDVDFQGRTTLAIRVSLKKPLSTQAKEAAAKPAPPPEPADQDGFDPDADTVPF